MALPGIVVGAILGFAKALGEFGATITFVGNIPNQTQTIPSAIYGFLQMPGKDQGALTLVFVSIVISVTALLLSEWLAGVFKNGCTVNDTTVSIRHQFSGFNLDITFTAGSGVTALFGRSGAGKSTIAQAISGAFAPTEGHIALNEEVLFSTDQRVNRPAHRRGIGYVFQQDLLFPHFSVQGNLEYAQRYGRSGTGTDQPVRSFGYLRH